MSKTAQKLGIKRYKLSDNEQYLIDELESLAENDDPDKEEENLKKINILKNYLTFVPDTKGRQFVVSKFLNTDPHFSKFKQSEDLDEDIAGYWNPVDDYVPPDVAKLQEKQDLKDFWNWESPKHWSKRTQGEIERRAEQEGYPDAEAFMDAVKQEQQLRDFDSSLDLGDHIVNFFFPRTSEAIRAGKYNDREDIKTATDLLTDKNFGMDMIENGMYAFDPAGRAIRSVATKGAEKLVSEGGKKALNYGSKVVANAMNPLAMEVADAALYADDEENDRSKGSGIDVLLGTGINTGMEALMSKIPGLKQIAHKDKLDRRVPTDESVSRIETIKSKRAINEATLEQAKKDLQLATDTKNAAGIIKNVKIINDLEKDNARLDDAIIFGDFPDRPTIKKERAKVQAQNVATDAQSLIGNKLGDLANEDPRIAKRIMRAGFHVPLAGQAINALYDMRELQREGFPAQRKLENKFFDPKTNKLKTDGLIYGLEDWRDE